MYCYKGQYVLIVYTSHEKITTLYYNFVSLLSKWKRIEPTRPYKHVILYVIRLHYFLYLSMNRETQRLFDKDVPTRLLINSLRVVRTKKTDFNL